MHDIESCSIMWIYHAGLSSDSQVALLLLKSSVQSFLSQVLSKQNHRRENWKNDWHAKTLQAGESYIFWPPRRKRNYYNKALRKASTSVCMQFFSPWIQALNPTNAFISIQTCKNPVFSSVEIIWLMLWVIYTHECYFKINCPATVPSMCFHSENTLYTGQLGLWRQE